MESDVEGNGLFLKKIHFPRRSVLSRPSSLNLHGIHNLIFLLLIFSNFRNIVYSISEYGILFNPKIVHSVLLPLLFLVIEVSAVSYALLITALLVEKHSSKRHIGERLTFALHIVLICAFLIIPVTITKLQHAPIIMESICLQLSTAYTMKSWSYMSVNYYLRNGYSVRKDEGTKYPNNLTLKDITYFFLAPTLCYEPNFPRNTERNYRKMAWLTFRLLLLMMVQLAIIQQVVIPILIATYNAGNIFSRMTPGDFKTNLVQVIEYIFYLAVPSMILWVLFFYGVFHCYLNLVAEVLKFADRQFYLDWWNATSISSFWRGWNIPVHSWLSRHVYEPLQKRGYNKNTSVVIVFALSAIFHEYVISVPVGITKYWAALAMLVQIPIHILLDLIKNFEVRNLLFWTTLIIGQPFLFTMYFLEYMKIHNVAYIDIYSIFEI